MAPRSDDGVGRLKVALMRGDDFHNLYLERLLASELQLVCTVEEPGSAQRHAIWRRRRWVDAAAAEYHRIRRGVFGKNRYRRRYFDPRHDGFPTVQRPAPLVVGDINDQRVGAAVEASGADLCVITCTTRLSSETIRAIGVPIVNIHGGHLPDYRGCHCFFTAIGDQRFDAVGSTIHFVDVGLDTGDVIDAVRPVIRHTDDPERLYSRAERLAAQRLVGHLLALESGVELPRSPQEFRGRLVLRRHRGPIDDVRFWLRRKTGSLVIPDIPGPAPQHPWESDESSSPPPRIA